MPKGEILQYVHMGFGSVYEQEVHMKIEKGMVVATWIVDNRGKPHHEREVNLRNFPVGTAITDSEGRLLLVNAPPGRHGNMGLNWIHGPANLSLDKNLIKRVKICRNERVRIPFGCAHRR